MHVSSLEGIGADMIRLGIRLPPDWHGHSAEWVWATDLGTGIYRIQNIPFYARGLSWLDEVTADSTPTGTWLTAVSRKSGHSTYRVFLNVEIESSAYDNQWRPLKRAGCRYERATDHLVAIDVPSNTDIAVAYAALEDGLRSGVWDFEEADMAHPVTAH